MKAPDIAKLRETVNYIVGEDVNGVLEYNRHDGNTFCYRIRRLSEQYEIMSIRKKTWIFGSENFCSVIHLKDGNSIMYSNEPQPKYGQMMDIIRYVFYSSPSYAGFEKKPKLRYFLFLRSKYDLVNDLERTDFRTNLGILRLTTKGSPIGHHAILEIPDYNDYAQRYTYDKASSSIFF